jgi:hypothetical protein
MVAQMEQVGYGQYIGDIIHRLPIGVPIYTENIAESLAKRFKIDLGKAKGLVNVNLKRIADDNNLERYQKGIYYKAQKTPFGKTKLNPDYIARDMYICKNGRTIGYETGASFLNKIGLTTQIAKYKYYATNVFKQNGSRVDKKLNILIRKPIVMVTDENYRYLQILDVIENKDKVSIDALHPEKIIFNYIKDNNLDFEKLVAYASKYYRKETLLRVGEIVACELL